MPKCDFKKVALQIENRIATRSFQVNTDPYMIDIESNQRNSRVIRDLNYGFVAANF